MYTKIEGAEFDTTNGNITPFSMSVEGLEGTGKTYLSLMTMPLPVIHVNYSDREATPYLYDMDDNRRNKTKLYSFRAKSTEGWSRDEGRESLAQLSTIAREEMGAGKLAGGTFIIDSGSSWWDVVQDVYVAPELQRQQQEYGKQVGGLAYGSGNLIVKGVVNWLKAQGAFVIITHQKAQEWDAKGPVVGRYRSRINSTIPYLVEVRLDLFMTCDVCGGPECQASKHVGRTHWARITKFGKNSNLIGLEIKSPTFATIYQLYTNRQLPEGVV